MIITCKNRYLVNDNELNVHDACIYSIEKRLVDGIYHYTIKANKEGELDDFIFSFYSVTSCLFTGENSLNLLGESINSCYSLPRYPNDDLAAASLTKDEVEELSQHGIYIDSNIQKNIRIMKQSYKSSAVKPEMLIVN